MCGFSISYVHQGEANSERYEELFRRGPDHQFEGVFKEEFKVFASRLAMVDQDELSNQPFGDQDRILVFNGEIYNHQSFRSRFLKDLDFVTESDTETLYHLLCQGKVSDLLRTESMFAFAFIDTKLSKIVIGRDAAGKKPIYFSRCKVKEDLQISSVLSCFRKENIRTLDEVSIMQYLNVGFILDPYTPYLSISSLAPGQISEINLSSEHVGIDLKTISESKTLSPPPTKKKNDLRELILSAVERRIEGQNRISISLSGGIDSSILALSLKYLGVIAHAYSVRWDDSDKKRYNDDCEIARAISFNLGHDFHEVQGPLGHEIPRMLLDYLSAMGEPSANPTGLSMMKLYEEAKLNGERLMLTGDGADESFFGYLRYSNMSKLPQSLYFLRQFLVEPKSRTSPLFDYSSTWANWSYWHSIFFEKEVHSYFKFSNKAKVEHLKRNEELLELYQNPNTKLATVERFQHLDRQIWLAMESNRRLDRVSMYHSIEARCPFQDRSILEFQHFSLQRDSYKNYLSKSQLIEAFPEVTKLIPERSKTGFISPIGHWIRSNKQIIKEQIEKMANAYEQLRIPGEVVLNFLESTLLRDLQKVWSLYSLAVWLELNCYPSFDIAKDLEPRDEII